LASTLYGGDGVKDKVVVVTGGSSGIGRATAVALAGEGAKVVIAARDAERGEEVVRRITAAGGQGMFVRTDVSKAQDVEALVTRAVQAYGRLDWAFNNAATEGVLRDTADFTEEEFDRVMGVNLKGVWLCMQHELRQMLAQKPPGGAIVNTSSVNGLGGAPLGAIYSATKAGVLALTKSAAQEYARHGIRVNALVAGAFDTPMLDSVFEQRSEISGVAPRDVKARVAAWIPMRRIGRPEEAASVAIWLCSDAASYVTGHSMIVDGGLTSPFC
jgi:NAD(P)-dependent dehydrogenase (short-subunit alcohol dehydrogenase family)